jgi:non-ribosomal peptide synthetase component F
VAGGARRSRTSSAGDPYFAELFERTKGVVVDALDHQELPFAQLVDALGVPRDPSRPPVVDTLCSMHDFTPDGETEGFPLKPGSARYDVELYVVPGEDGALSCAFTYKTGLFEESTIARMAGQLEELLRAAVADPTLPVSRLPLAGDAALIAGWNDTAADFPSAATLHGLIEEQVARTPGAIAVTFAGRSWTYRELDERANQIAHRLAGLDVGPGKLVAVCAERSLELVAGLLGVLKTGAVIGVGPGRGIGFLYLVCALGMFLVVAGALRVKRLARFDTDMPDALADDIVGAEAVRQRVTV